MGTRLGGDERLAVACGGSVLLWDPLADSAHGDPVTLQLGFPVSAISWNQNNKVVCAAGANARNGSALLFYHSGRAMGGLPVAGDVRAMSFSCASKLLALASAECVEVWRLKNAVRIPCVILFCSLAYG